MWLRMMPSNAHSRTRSTAELKKMLNHQFVPLGINGRSVSTDELHGDDGYGIFVPLGEALTTPAVAYVFNTGEIWSVDTYTLGAAGQRGIFLENYRPAMEQYAAILKKHLGFDPPYRCVVGMEGVSGRPVWLPHRQGRIFLQNPYGACAANIIKRELIYKDSDTPSHTLRPFFEDVLDKCGCDDFSILND